MPINTYGDISPRTAAFAIADLLKRGQTRLVTERFGQKDAQGKNKSTTRKYRRYKSLAPATAPLAEGVTPTGSMIQYEDVQCTLQQYGDFVRITDVIQDTHEDPVLKEMSSVCGEQCADTIELIRIAVLKSGSNVFYAGGVTSRANVASVPNRGDLRKIVRALRKAKAKEIGRIISATPNVATEPVAPAYFALGHTDLDSDIRSMPGFIPVEKYSDSTKALDGEIGKVESIRFILTTMFDPWEEAGASGTVNLSGGGAPVTAARADVYPLLIVAQDAYGIVPLQGGESVKIVVKNPGTASDSDPLAQRGFVSWKTMQTAVILNNAWMVRYECAVTANPA